MSRSRACIGQKRDGSCYPCFNIFPEIVARAIVSRMTSSMNMILKYTVQSWSTVSYNFIHDEYDVLRFKKYDSFRKSHAGPTKMSSSLRFHDSGVPPFVVGIRTYVCKIRTYQTNTYDVSSSRVNKSCIYSVWHEHNAVDYGFQFEIPIYGRRIEGRFTSKRKPNVREKE